MRKFKISKLTHIHEISCLKLFYQLNSFFIIPDFPSILSISYRQSGDDFFIQLDLISFELFRFSLHTLLRREKIL